MGKRQEYISDETAQKLAIRAWLGSYFPPQEHGIDADEEQDLVERAGSSVVVLTGIYTVEWPGKCTIMCYFSTAACAACPHDGAKQKKAHEPEVQLDLTDVRVLLQKYGNCLHLPPKKVEPMFQSRNDACFDQYALASNCRGSRGRAEQRVSGRMGF